MCWGSRLGPGERATCFVCISRRFTETRFAPLWPPMEGSLFRHLATPLELRLVVDHLDEDDAFAFASTCRAFRAATCLAGSVAARFGERGIHTSVPGCWPTRAWP